MKRNYTLIIALAIISIGLTINAIAEEPHAREPSFNTIQIWQLVDHNYSGTHAKVIAELGDAWFGALQITDFSGGNFAEVDLAHRWYVDDHIAIYGGAAVRRIWVSHGDDATDYVAELGVAMGFNQHLEGRLEAGYNIIASDDAIGRAHNYWHYNAELTFHPKHFEGFAFTGSMHYDVYNDNWRPGIGVAYHW